MRYPGTILCIIQLLTITSINLCRGDCIQFYSTVICEHFEELQVVPSGVLRVIVGRQLNKALSTTPILSRFSSLLNLTISNAEIPIMSTDAFKSLPELEYLCINNSNVEKFDFNNLAKVETLVLDDNKMQQAVQPAARMPELTWITIKRNNLKTFTISSQNAPKLQAISLQENQLESFRIESKTVEKIYLNDNRIKTFSNQDLNVPNCMGLDLHNNLLQFVKREMLNNCKQLVYLDLNGNPLLATAELP